MIDLHPPGSEAISSNLGSWSAGQPEPGIQHPWKTNQRFPPLLKGFILSLIVTKVKLNQLTLFYAVPKSSESCQGLMARLNYTGQDWYSPDLHLNHIQYVFLRQRRKNLKSQKQKNPRAIQESCEVHSENTRPTSPKRSTGSTANDSLISQFHVI